MKGAQGDLSETEVTQSKTAYLAIHVLKPVVPPWIMLCSSFSVTRPCVGGEEGRGKKKVL